MSLRNLCRGRVLRPSFVQVWTKWEAKRLPYKCGKLLSIKEYHTFSPARKYAKSRREPPVWFSDSPDGLRGKRIGFHIAPIIFRFPLRNPLARSTEIILILSALRTHSFYIQHSAFCTFTGQQPDKQEFDGIKIRK